VITTIVSLLAKSTLNLRCGAADLAKLVVNILLYSPETNL